MQFGAASLLLTTLASVAAAASSWDIAIFTDSQCRNRIFEVYSATGITSCTKLPSGLPSGQYFTFTKTPGAAAIGLYGSDSCGNKLIETNVTQGCTRLSGPVVAWIGISA